jgi:hypothetical protein
MTKISPTVKLTDSYQKHIDKDTSLAALADYITSISLNPSGFDVTVTNSLPSGNDISLGITSAFLKMDTEVSNDFPAGCSALKKSYRGTAAETHAITESTEIDIDATIGLPGYEEVGGEKIIKISNVQPGKTYTIDIHVDPVFD